MSHTTEAAAPESPLDRIGLGWMEDMPKGAWIALMVIGFILFWPIGLAILGYMTWSGKLMRGWKHGCGRHSRRRHSRPTGNTAFDDYRAETLKRLEEEQEAFQSFLDRLRRAKDREEFEAFINERKGSADGDPASA